MARPKTDSLRLKLHDVEIIQLYLNGYSKDELGRMFGTSSTLILRIIRAAGAARSKEQESVARLRQAAKESRESRSIRGKSRSQSIQLKKRIDPNWHTYWVEKRELTCKARYGVRHHMMNASIKEKAISSWKAKGKTYQFSNGASVRTAGHGTLALGILEASGYTSDDIETEVYKGVKYANNNKLSMHIFDIYIPKENRVIEVKCKTHPKFGYDADVISINNKKNASVALGFKYEIWVFHANKLVEIH